MILTKKLSFLFFTSLLLLACGDDDSSDKFWNNIEASAKYTPLTFVFSSTEIGACEKAGQSDLDMVLNSQINGIKGTDINGIVLHPSITANHYSPMAEELKFIFDENGDGSFTSFPSFVNNMKCYGSDTAAWHASVITDLSKSAGISLGFKIENSSKKTIVYVKGVYNETISSNHAIGLYSYTKSISGTQESENGGPISFTHKNVATGAITNSYGKTLSSNSSGEEFHEKFEFDNPENASNIGYIAVVYLINNDNPIEVVNSIKF